jgi:NADH dehydrogenase FAD-containing subunit
MPHRKRLVLVGAGHAHLYTLKRAAAFVERGHELTLIAPDDFWYSGLATGMLGGWYPPELDRIDVGALVTRAGGHFVKDCVTGLDTGRRTVTLGAGGTLAYDALSLNLGSETPPIPGEELHPDRCFAAKPIRRLWDLRRAVEQRLSKTAAQSLRIVVAGGGATAFELAGNLLRLGEASGSNFTVAILAGGEGTILAQLPTKAAHAVVAALQIRGATIFPGHRVTGIESAEVVTGAGHSHPYDLFVNATGLRPHPLARAAGLPVAPDGAMIVDAHLRSPADPLVHAGGDAVAFEGRRLPQAGVFAIRQAPFLCANLLASLEGQEPQLFRPSGAISGS